MMVKKYILIDAFRTLEQLASDCEYEIDQSRNWREEEVVKKTIEIKIKRMENEIELAKQLIGGTGNE